MDSNNPIQPGLQATNYSGLNAATTGARKGAEAGTKTDSNIGALLNGTEAGAKAGVEAANKEIKLNDEKGSQGFCVDEHSTKGGVVHALLGPLYHFGCKIFGSN